MNRKVPSKIQTATCKRAACGLVVPPYHRAKPINLPSNATVANRGRPPAFFETLGRPSTLRASRLRIPRRVLVADAKINQSFRVPAFDQTGVPRISQVPSEFITEGSIICRWSEVPRNPFSLTAHGKLSPLLRSYNSILDSQP